MTVARGAFYSGTVYKKNTINFASHYILVSGDPLSVGLRVPIKVIVIAYNCNDSATPEPPDGASTTTKRGKTPHAYRVVKSRCALHQG